MKTELGCQDSYQEFENYFQTTSESKLYKKFLRKWKEPEIAKKVFDYKSKKYVKS